MQNIINCDPAAGASRFGLTETGKAQAKRAGEKLKDILASEHDVAGRTYVVASEFRRARETAEIIHSELGVRAPLKTDRALWERNMGRMDMQPADTAQAVWARDLIDPAHRDYGNESVLDVIERMAGALQRLCAEYNDAIILMVTHGDPALILRGAFLGVPPERIRSDVPHFNNCDVVELTN